MSRVTIGLLLLLMVVGAAAQRPCLRNGKCEARGCAPAGSMAAKANEIRNTAYDLRRKYEPHNVCVEDLRKLQDVTRGPQGFHVRDRKDFTSVEITTCLGRRVTLGEKSFVSMVGLIVGTPRAPVADSANCRQQGRDNNSFRLNLVDSAMDNEFNSVRVVLTPRMRRIGPQWRRNWDWSTLAAIARSGRPVRVTGPLFYDSKHMVNSDPENELSDEPRRASLWEIHPVVLIELCTQKKSQRCFDPSTATWEKLEDAQWIR